MRLDDSFAVLVSSDFMHVQLWTFATPGIRCRGLVPPPFKSVLFGLVKGSVLAQSCLMISLCLILLAATL